MIVCVLAITKENCNQNDIIFTPNHVIRMVLIHFPILVFSCNCDFMDIYENNKNLIFGKHFNEVREIIIISYYVALKYLV